MISPLTEAVRKLSRKTPIGSVLTSAEWELVPLELRERAQFSARVESAKVLQGIQDRLAAELQLLRETVNTTPTGEAVTATYDRSSFIDRIREIARSEGLTPEDESIQGTIQDITSIPRLGLIYDIQKSQAQEYARWKFDQEEGALDLYPAQRLVRVEDRYVPRDWEARWLDAANQVGYDGVNRGPDKVALKTSPVWETLSRFGTPWPPFDYGSGMGIEDVDRDEAIRLGLITEDTVLEPAVDRFNSKLQASVQSLSPELQDALKTAFGGQVTIQDGTAHWNS